MWGAIKKAINSDLTTPLNSLLDTLLSRLTAGRASNLDNLDTSVSSRQPDVLSSTQANRLDTTVSSRSSHSANDVANLIDAGIDWSDKSFTTSVSTGSHEENTQIDITGRGYLVSLFGGRYASQWGVEIDGTIYNLFGSSNEDGTTFPMFPTRFNSSLKISNDRHTAFCWVVLD